MTRSISSLTRSISSRRYSLLANINLPNARKTASSTRKCIGQSTPPQVWQTGRRLNCRVLHADRMHLSHSATFAQLHILCYWGGRWRAGGGLLISAVADMLATQHYASYPPDSRHLTSRRHRRSFFSPGCCLQRCAPSPKIRVYARARRSARGPGLLWRAPSGNRSSHEGPPGKSAAACNFQGSPLGGAESLVRFYAGRRGRAGFVWRA